MTAKGVISIGVFLIHFGAAIGVMAAIWQSGMHSFDALMATYFASMGAFLSFALVYNAFDTEPDKTLDE